METLYLPSVIVLVEGKTDHAFIDRVLTVKFPNQQFSVLNATSDNKIKEVLHVARSLFMDLQRSPYRDRIIAVVDKVHMAGLRDSLVSMGLAPENVVIWSDNGVEFVYPDAIIDSIYGSGSKIVVSGDMVSRNGITFTKSDLSAKVCSRIHAGCVMSSEFEQKFLSRVRSIVD